MSRIAMLAKVHIAKKELALSDDAYRDILKRVVNRASAGDCNDGQLSRLLAEFNRLGWTHTHKRPLSEKAHVRMIYGLFEDIKKLLDGKAGDRELRSFVQRQTRSPQHPDGVAAPEFLNATDATRVIEGLKGWRARLQAGEKGEPA